MLKKRNPIVLIVYVICVLCLNISCNKKTGNVVNGRPAYNINLKKSHKEYLKHFDTLFSNLEIIPLHTKDSSIVASVSKVIVKESRFYVLDKSFSQVFCFDSTGNEQLKYGSVGLGVGQYQKITDFDILGNTVAILSNNDQAVFLYDRNTGKFTKRLNIDLFGYSLALLPDKSILIYVNQNSNNKNEDNNVICIDSIGNVINRYFPYNPKISSMAITFSGFLKKVNDTTYYSPPFTNFVYRYENGRFSQFINWGINDKFVEANNQQFEAIYKESIIRDPNTSFLQDAFLKNKDFLICSYQDSIHVVFCYYNIHQKKSFIYRKDIIQDPNLLLIGRPQWITDQNEIISSTSGDYIQYLKTSLSDLYSNLSPDKRKILDNINKNSNPILIRCKIKPQ